MSSIPTSYTCKTALDEHPPASRCPSPDAAALAASPISTPSTLWIPLYEPAELWAQFGAAFVSHLGFAATSHAFRALSWESSALHQHGRAWQEQHCGNTYTAARLFDRSTAYLERATQHWEKAMSWLEQLAHAPSHWQTTADAE